MAPNDTNNAGHTGARAAATPSPDTISRQLDDSAVLIQMRTSRIYELNGTAARIWSLLEQGADRDGVVDAIVDEFQIDRAEAAGAVDALIEELRTEGLLQS